MPESDAKITENLAGCVVAMLLMPVMIGLRGWVVSLLWRWLVVPTFGLVTLGVWQAIGLSVIIAALFMKAPKPDDGTVLETTIRVTLFALTTYASLLLLGWIVSQQI
jgi:hypothetical protein